ncbi:hypothetical protein BGW39_009775 [Mortierella sp. 14UC]|nr:hypothetical protein BGW39_009775 [Mortierella sp. 14UC]
MAATLKQTYYTLKDINTATGLPVTNPFNANIKGIDYFVPIGSGYDNTYLSSALFTTSGGQMFGVKFAGDSANVA